MEPDRWDIIIEYWSLILWLTLLLLDSIKDKESRMCRFLEMGAIVVYWLVVGYRRCYTCDRDLPVEMTFELSSCFVLTDWCPGHKWVGRAMKDQTKKNSQVPCSCFEMKMRERCPSLILFDIQLNSRKGNQGIWCSVFGLGLECKLFSLSLLSREVFICVRFMWLCMLCMWRFHTRVLEAGTFLSQLSGIRFGSDPRSPSSKMPFVSYWEGERNGERRELSSNEKRHEFWEGMFVSQSSFSSYFTSRSQSLLCVG